MTDSYSAQHLVLPHRIDDIDAIWLTSALRVGGNDGRVTKSTIVDIIHGTCTKIRLALEYDHAGQSAGLPSTMILKGGFESHSESMAEMYRAEARFYQQVAPNAPIHMPHAWFAGVDAVSWQGLILMDDLAAKGARFCRAQEPFGYKHIAWRLEMLAGLHARTWQSDDIMPGGRWGWLQTRFDGFAKEYNARYLIPDVWDHYITSPRGAAISTRLHDREWMAHALNRLGEIQDQSPVCMIHGDTHPGNLYLEADDTPGFLDPSASRACWWLEVAYHITASLDIADRRNWEAALLSHYLAALERAGGPRLDFDEAWLRYRQSIAYGLFIFLINETRFQTEATNTAYTARFSAAAIDHDTVALLA